MYSTFSCTISHREVSKVDVSFIVYDNLRGMGAVYATTTLIRRDFKEKDYFCPQGISGHLHFKTTCLNYV